MFLKIYDMTKKNVSSIRVFSSFLIFWTICAWSEWSIWGTNLDTFPCTPHWSVLYLKMDQNCFRNLIMWRPRCFEFISDFWTICASCEWSIREQVLDTFFLASSTGFELTTFQIRTWHLHLRKLIIALLFWKTILVVS